MGYDVLEVGIGTGIVRVMDRGMDEKNAEAYIKMAVYRRGVENHFFVAANTGKYNDGDKYDGVEGPTPAQTRADREGG